MTLMNEAGQALASRPRWVVDPARQNEILDQIRRELADERMAEQLLRATTDPRLA